MNPIQFLKDKFLPRKPVADDLDDEDEDDDESSLPVFLQFLLSKPVLISLAVIAIAAVSAKPVYRQIVAWRAHALAEKAMAQVKAKDLAGAGLTVRAAFQLSPSNHEVMRAAATVLALSGDPASLSFLKEIMDFPDVTMDERRQFVGLAVMAGSNFMPIAAKVEEQLRILHDKEPDSARNWLLSARVYDLSGDTERATICARRAHELDPGLDDATLLLASELLRSKESYEEGADLLWTLVEGGGANSFPAAVFASQLPVLSRERTEVLIKRLKTEPGSKQFHRLRALDLEIRSHPENREALMDEVQKTARSLDPASLAELGAWFNSRGESVRALAVVPEDIAKTDRGLLLVHLDALAARKQWLVVQDLISAKDVPLEPFTIEVFKARCAMELGNQDDAAEHWREAQSAAAGNPEHSFYVAKYARQFGRNSQAEAIYRSFIESAQTARPAFMELLAMSAADGTAAQAGILEEMHARWPKDETIENDRAYFALLLGRDIKQNLEAARALFKASPGSMAHRTLLALAFLRRDNPGEALRLYEGVDFRWANQSTTYRAIYAAVLEANGRPADAAAILGAIRPGDLRPEERALIRFDSAPVDGTTGLADPTLPTLQ